MNSKRWILPLLLTCAPLAHAFEKLPDPGDRLRIKFQAVETSAVESPPVRVRARLLVCVGPESTPKCLTLTEAGPLEFGAYEFKDYDSESAETMPALFSPEISVSDVQARLDELPPGDYGAPLLRVELRQDSVFGPGADLIATAAARLPTAEERKDSGDHMMQWPLTLEPQRSDTITRVRVDILINRP